MLGNARSLAVAWAAWASFMERPQHAGPDPAEVAEHFLGDLSKECYAYYYAQEAAMVWAFG